MRNNNQPPRRGSSSERPTGFYLAYLEKLIAKRASERPEQADDLEFEEAYWRNRERLHVEKNLAACKKGGMIRRTVDSRKYRDAVPFQTTEPLRDIGVLFARLGIARKRQCSELF